MSMTIGHPKAPIATSSARRSVRRIALPTLLSVIAGSLDAIGFLGIGGLFVAHVTGNLVILSAHLASGGDASVAAMLSVPVFVLALGLTRILVSGLDSIGLGSLRPLLTLQFLLLAGFLSLCVSTGSCFRPDAGSAVVAGMLGVSAMAVQNALVQVSLIGAPSTAVMTINITRFVMDVGEAFLGRDWATATKARSRAKRTWPTIVGFTVGCGLGAACESAIGLEALVLPVALALLAIAMGDANLDRRPDS
jgi:uncharacterized membrane protein YoaK (UPF0700 family)